MRRRLERRRETQQCVGVNRNVAGVQRH
jgi:hypothetical protein